MKIRSFAAFLLLILCPLLFVSCKKAEAKEGINVVASVFPAYDFARQICGDDANVTLLLPPGAEIHSYAPTAKDIIAIEECDLFIYTGGESDVWIETVLSSIDKNVNTLKMVDCVTLLSIESDHGDEYDEHVWTSPVNAISIVDNICRKMVKADPENESEYLLRSVTYKNELERLDAAFEALFSSIPEERRVLFFGDRFPFRYFAKEYSLSFLSAYPSCAGESEPDIATVTKMIDDARKMQVSTVFYIEFSNSGTAKTIAAEVGASTSLLHSCHNVTKKQFESGITYVDLMMQNLETLTEALK